MVPLLGWLADVCFSIDRFQYSHSLSKIDMRARLRCAASAASSIAASERTRAAAEAFIAAMPRRGHIFNLGHGIMPTTPHESVAALIEVLHAEADA